MKEVVISSLRFLLLNEKIEIYAFAIMLNDVHFIWQAMQMNGKEKLHKSFFTVDSNQLDAVIEEMRKEAVTLFL